MIRGGVQGGVVQGIAGSSGFYDEDSQPRNTRFMEFLMPYATLILDIEMHHVETPSPLNPLGIKGEGEAGTIPVPAMLASAIEDAIGIPVSSPPISKRFLKASACRRCRGRSAWPSAPGR